jgi:hypothetical protein
MKEENNRAKREKRKESGAGSPSGDGAATIAEQLKGEQHTNSSINQRQPKKFQQSTSPNQIDSFHSSI